MSKRCAIYSTDEVIEKEFEVLKEKLGSEEKAAKAIEQWLESELDANDKLDPEDIHERFEHTIENEGEDIWICMKIYNINNLWKMFGTEPE